MRFKILGHIEVEQDGEPVEIGPYKERSLLALLLVNANQIVPTDRLIEQLWGEAASREKQNVLWVHLSNLRRALEPDREKARESIIATKAPGYMLDIEPGAVDASEFENLVEEGRSIVPDDPATASTVLSNALAMWRGPALEDFVYEDWAQPEIRRLTDLRLEAVEARIDADLARGLASELVGELESLSLQNPLDEHLVRQLMLAQYRSGRQSDALRSYTSFRTHITEELGVEPSPTLQQLEDRILLADSALLDSSATSDGGFAPGLAIRGYELRREIGAGRMSTTYRAYQPTVGREVVVKVARSDLADHPEFVRRFETKARLLASLEHPNIVPLYDYWREPGAAYLVMPFMGQGTLAQRLAHGALEEDEADRILQQVGGALAAAHRRGIVHGDVKGSNILLDEEGNAYLGDFQLTNGSAHTAGLPDEAYASPEQLRGEPATAASDVYSLAAVIRSAVENHGPVPSVLDRALSEDPADRYADADALVTALKDLAAGGPAPRPVTPVRNPFKGLHAFQQGDADDFFGRERTVEHLISRLGHPGSQGRFLTVVGPSGCGKTSVVRAGLVPALQRGALPRSDSWFVAEMAPAPHPIEELADSLQAVSTRSLPGLLDTLMSGATGLEDALPMVLPDDRSDLVLIVDQFEELFTQVDEDEASRFMAAIVEAASAVDSRLRVVITLRADFYDRPLSHPLLGELIRDSTIAMTPMTPEELERAIQGPAEQVSVRFDEGLVAHLISDVALRPGSLPLLQYTLTELFEKRVGGLIPAQAYHDIGGISASLANRADAVFRSLSRVDQETTRKVFLHLVTLGDGEADTRRRVRVTELAKIVPAIALNRIIEDFGRRRLLTFDRDSVSREPTVEIAHEALLRDWPDLRQWLAQSRDDLRLAQRLETAAIEWSNEGRDPGYLLRGSRLAQAAHFVEESSVDLSPLAEELVEASSRTQREERRRRHRLRRRITAGFGIAAVVASILAILALLGQREASEAADLARSKELALAASSSDVVSQDPELGLLLAIQSASIAEPSVESLAALHNAIAQQRTVFNYSWPSDQEYWVVGGDINADGTALVASAVFGDYVEVVSTTSGERMWSVEFDGRLVAGAYFIEEGSKVIVGVAPDPSQGHLDEDSVGLFIYAADSGRELRHESFGTCGAYLPANSKGVSETKTVLFTRPGVDCSSRPVDSGAFDVYVFDTSTGEFVDLGLRGFPLHYAVLAQSEAVVDFTGAVISGDGSVAAVDVGVGVHRVSYRNTANGGPLRSGIDEWIEAVALNQDGSQTITGAFDERGRAAGRPQHLGEAAVFDSWSGQEIAAFDGHDALPTDAVFSPDGDTVYSVGPDGFVRAWDPETGEQAWVAPGGLDPRAVALSGDGSHLLVFDSGTQARVLDLAPEAAVEIGRGMGELFERAARESDDGVVRVTIGWPPPYFFSTVSRTDSEVPPLEVRSTINEFGEATLIPNSHRVILAWSNQMYSVDGDTLTITAERQWAPGGPLPKRLLTPSPDGRFVAGTGAAPLDFSLEGAQPIIEIFDPETLDPVLVIQGAHSSTITDLEVSPGSDLIASGARDGWARVWSSTDGGLVHAIHAPGPVHGIEFAQDGNHLVVTLDDATTFDYTLDAEDLLDIARSRLTRGFTEAECLAYGMDPCPTLDEMLQS